MSQQGLGVGWGGDGAFPQVGILGESLANKTLPACLGPPPPFFFFFFFHVEISHTHQFLSFRLRNSSL